MSYPVLPKNCFIQVWSNCQKIAFELLGRTGLSNPLGLLPTSGIPLASANSHALSLRQIGPRIGNPHVLPIRPKITIQKSANECKSPVKSSHLLHPKTSHSIIVDFTRKWTAFLCMRIYLGHSDLDEIYRVELRYSYTSLIVCPTAVSETHEERSRI